MSVTVLLEVQVKLDVVEEMKSLVRTTVEDTRAYDGCQVIDIYGNTDDPGNLVFVMGWDSRKHYERYLAWRRETGTTDQLVAMLVAPPSIRYFRRIDA